MTQHLTSSRVVRSYLSITTNIDPVINPLIERASDYIQRYTARTFPKKVTVNRRLHGTGSTRLHVPDNPILSIEALQVDQLAVTASDGVTDGYLFDDHMIYLANGQKFTAGFNNVLVSWTAGYRAEESAVVPAGNFPTLTPSTGGRASEAISVTYDANSVVLTKVDSGPTAGQYALSEDGEYSFNTADGNKSVTMAYYYVPPTIVQACIELVGLRLTQRDKIGLKTKSLATESITYEDAEVTPSIKALLAQFAKRVPN